MGSEFKQVPVIDISGLRSRDEQERRRVAHEIGEAAAHVGFFYISGHGVPEATIRGAKRSAEWLFAQPLERKMEVYIGQSTCHRGYVPEGEEVFKEGARPDHKEAFDLGRELGPDHALVRAGRPFHGPNQWPRDAPAFRADVTRYYDAVLALSRVLLRGFALALGLDEDEFGREFTEPLAACRLVHYPRGDAESQGIGEHTDYECFTILYTDTPGLEVVNGQGEWIAVPPVPHTFVVNIGDTLEILTNGRFVATAHRVRQVKAERYSFPMFVGCNYDTRVAPLPRFVRDGTAPRHAAVRSGDHVWSSVMQTHRYLRARLAAGESLPAGTAQFGAYGHEVFKEQHRAAS